MVSLSRTHFDSSERFKPHTLKLEVHSEKLTPLSERREQEICLLLEFARNLLINLSYYIELVSKPFYTIRFLRIPIWIILDRGQAEFYLR